MSELLKINVNEHTEKKSGLTYLSWAWAWAEVLKIDPHASWRMAAMTTASPVTFLPDGSALVCVAVRIREDEKMAVLPVMDHRNKAIKNPDAFAVNTAVMRCLCKAIAMHGLGLYIYAGEDLPEADPDNLVPLLEQSIEQEKQKREGVMAAVLPAVEDYLDGPTKAALAKLAGELTELFKMPGGQSIAFIRMEREGLSPDEKLYLASRLDSKVRNALKRERDQRALASAATKETA